MSDQLGYIRHLLNEVVVVDTKSTYVYIGRLVHVDERFWVLEDVDVHDCSEGRANKENYILEAARYGLTHNRRQALVRVSEIVSCSRLSDVACDV